MRAKMQPVQPSPPQVKKPKIATDRLAQSPVHLNAAVDLHPDDGYLAANEVCAILGGKEHPISKATLYRNIKAGRLPPPEHPTPGISRWRPSQIREAMANRQMGTRIEAQIPPITAVGVAP